MSGMGAVPPPIPPEVLDEERERIRRQLEIERGKSRVLYEKAYQAYLRGVSPTEKEQAQTVSEPDFYADIRKAYSQAYALRAFREVMDETSKPGLPAPQTIPSTDNVTTSLMKSGLPPQVVSQWVKSMDPEALGALIALSSNNPMLAMMSFAMSQRQGQQQLTIKDVIELNAALAKRETQPNISLNIPELIREVKSQPQGADPEKIVNATIGAIQTGMQLAAPKGGGGESKPRLGILESLIAQGPEGMKIAKELGMIGGDAPYLQIMAEMRKNDQEFQKTMRSSDRAWQLRLEEMRLRGNIEKAKLMESRRRTDLIAGSLRRIGETIAQGVSEGLEPVEGKKTEGETEESEDIKQYKCEGELPDGTKCGAMISVPPGTKPGAVVTCARCGAQYEATKPEEAQK